MITTNGAAPEAHQATANQDLIEGELEHSPFPKLRPNNAILLEVDDARLAALDPAIEVAGRNGPISLPKKSEFHVTLFDGKLGGLIEKSGIRDDLMAHAAQQDFTPTLKADFRVIDKIEQIAQKGQPKPDELHKTSVIMMVGCPGAASMYEKAAELAAAQAGRTDIDPKAQKSASDLVKELQTLPPTHVTLYTTAIPEQFQTKSMAGIGIRSEAFLNERTVPGDHSAMQSALKEKTGL